MKRLLAALLIVALSFSLGYAETAVRELPLNGRMRTADDPATIGPSDFATLTNLRYNVNNPKGIGGMTKINTAALGNPQIKNGIHFTRTFPTAESHVLVSARDGSGLNQKVYRNDTAIPSAGAFNATALFADASGYGTGRFSLAPDGIAYANGKDTALWLGDEANASGFIDYDPNGTYRYDYTEQVKNSLTDSNNIATLHRKGGTSDANTVLLLHFDTDLTDSSPATPHTVTANGNAAVSATQTKFGAKSASFDGTGDYLTVSYVSGTDTDFDFSGGTWTIDFWNRDVSGNVAGTWDLYEHSTDASNYLNISAVKALVSGVYRSKFVLTIQAAGSPVVSLSTAQVYSTGAANWWHVAVVENGANYYIFVNGSLAASTSDTDRAVEYTGTPYIGGNGVNSDFMGYIDEFHVSNTARWTAAFEPPTQAYGNQGITSLYIRSMIPASGAKFYVGTANTAAATAAAFEWIGTGWSAVSSLSDGTASAGKSLAQTGSMTWTSTASTSVPKFIDGIQGYWYKIEISGAVGLDNTTTVSQVSVLSSMQQIRDIWDGTFLSIGSFQKYASSTYNDYTTNVFENDYDSTNSATFATLDALATATDFIVAGFPTRQSALRIGIIGGSVNTTAGTVLTVYYWNGTAWTSVGSVDDGTAQGGISFAKSGVVSWNPASITSEHKQILAGAKKTESLYYYKMAFSQNFSATVRIYNVAGILAQTDLRGYKFPFYHLSRLCLANNADKEPNAVLCSIPYSSHIFNGPDSLPLSIGDGKGLTAGASIYSRFGSTLNSVALFFKESETWVWLGTTKEDLRIHQLSPSIGCNAPLTVKVVPAFDTPDASGGGGIGRSLAIWQGAAGIYMSDGAAISKISNDIRDKFDPLHANYVGAATLATTTASYDPVNDEYHWIIPGAGEWVFDLRKAKWFRIDRQTGKYLQCGIEVTDTNGTPYTYGALSTGYLERLEYGNTFDGTAIPYTLRTGDLALHNGSIWRDTTIRKIKVVQLAKTVTASTPTLTHFGDSKTTGTTYSTYSAASSGKRLAFTTPPDIRLGPHFFHGLQLTQSTSDETAPGFEPLFIGVYYETASDLIR
mgnify:CR=1 FL=1